MELLMESWRKFLKEVESPLTPGEDDSAIAASIEQVYDSGPAAVRAFMNSPAGKDLKVRQFLHRAEQEYDGDASDDNIEIGRTNPALNTLIPTQKYIDLMQSVSFPLGSAAALKRAILSKKAFGVISVSGDHILDGHHRWSGQFAITPAGSVTATDIGMPGDPGQKLAGLQLAIAAIDPSINDPHPSKGGGAKTNILGANGGLPAADIYEKIMANINEQPDLEADGPLLNDAMVHELAQSQDPTVLQWAGLKPGQAKDAQQMREAIAKKVAANLAALPAFAEGAPDRPDMPQLDHPSIGGKKATQKIKSRLATGDLNVVPPFDKAK